LGRGGARSDGVRATQHCTRLKCTRGVKLSGQGRLDNFVALSYFYDMNAHTHDKPYQLTADELRLTQVMKALGHPARMQIVRYLRDNPQCFTGDIVNVLPLAQATVSQHLKVLREAGLICGTIDGPATSYCLDEDTLRWLGEQVGLLL
jgi:ArsR family transcriptional regulator